LLDAKVASGTVATAECCYGAELYDPADAQGQMGICSTYLAGGAYGFFGSSTIAYGPANGNGAADLICQYFLKHVLGGASLGRAALQARHDFTEGAGTLGPIDLKTLAQFNLFGDPSIHPVEPVRVDVAVPHGAVAGLAAKSLNQLTGRSARRARLQIRGESIKGIASFAVRSATLKLAAPASKALHKLAKEAGVDEKTLVSFRVRGPKGSLYKKTMMAKAARRAAFHVLFADATKEASPSRQLLALIAKEEDGRIVSYEQYLSR
jgi:hypothetical protein